jgi:hypothetical protein
MLFRRKKKITELEIFGILDRLPDYKNSKNPRTKEYAAWQLSKLLSEKGIRVEQIYLPRPPWN